MFRGPIVPQFLILNQKRIRKISTFISQIITFLYAYFYCRNYCSALKDQRYDNSEEIINCLDLKEFKQYSATVEQVGMDYEDSKKSYFGTDSNVEFALKSISKKANIFEEVLIFDETSLVGSLGGSLGLFVGFSFFGYVTPILEAVFDKVASFFLRMNQCH